jgi:hypothetical protein
MAIPGAAPHLPLAGTSKKHRNSTEIGAFNNDGVWL